MVSLTHSSIYREKKLKTLSMIIIQLLEFSNKLSSNLQNFGPESRNIRVLSIKQFKNIEFFFRNLIFASSKRLRLFLFQLNKI